MGTIRERQHVISYGQLLCDRADEELFCMFTNTDLLEAGSLTRIRDASRIRGADVYIGTGDPTVRQYIQEHAPDVTIWKPETNWLDLPVEGEYAGRLLLADREAVMIGTLGKKHDDGFHKEQAIVGEGYDNALVIILTHCCGLTLIRSTRRPKTAKHTSADFLKNWPNFPVRINP